MSKAFISVIVPAAGSGKRMNAGKRKQFILLDGNPILYHTISKLNNSNINEIVVVCPEEDIEYTSEILSDFSKVTAVIAGGKERQDSVVNGLSKVSAKATAILVHDGVRPFIRKSEIDKICAALEHYEAAVVAVPVKNTIKVIENGFVKETPDRSKLWAIQTPQGMKADIFRKCYEKLVSEIFLGTDESMIAEHYGHRVHVVRGEYTNIKITTPEDLDVGKLFLAKEKDER